MTTTTDTTVNLTANGSTFEAGNATLSRPADALEGVRCFVVIPDQHAAAHFGVHARAGKVVGGIAFSETHRRWYPMAYTNHQHAKDGSGPVYDLPKARSRAAAVRALLRWWNAIDCGKLPGDAKPWELSKRDQEYLTA